MQELLLDVLVTFSKRLELKPTKPVTAFRALARSSYESQSAALMAYKYAARKLLLSGAHHKYQASTLGTRVERTIAPL
ncbi:hypothetical protein [Burkholderia lata]|uniref:hypothetical protein n=1 Tax=Burkholderia lata (strain ATCC 17760 / DSM 23089 / LMG 22485 / NCIMB 9086 / R18194 / 383) TaxID=482957 RepID=UPI001582010F|nr:hypothetical protein [Burkholderia lata]